MPELVTDPETGEEFDPYDGLHYSEAFEENDEGWWEPSCSCGKKLGAFPTAEDACDALMQHSYESGYIDATDLYRSPRRA